MKAIHTQSTRFMEPGFVLPVQRVEAEFLGFQAVIH